MSPTPADPYASKAIVSAIGTIVLAALRWAVSGEFQLSDEGLITLAGAITTVAVYSVSNYRRVLGLRSERGYGVVELLVAVILLLLLIWLVVALIPNADAALAFRSSWG